MGKLIGDGILSPSSASPWLRIESLTETLRALVHINSVNPAYGGPEGGEATVIATAAEFLARAALTPETWEVHPGRPNLRVRLSGRDRRRFKLFETHVDTVSAAGMTIEPFKGDTRDGRLWGRGATDAKGQAVAMLHGLVSLAKSGPPPPTDLEVVLSVDEEAGFTGVRSLVRRYEAEGARPEVAIIGEPTDLRIVTAHKGTLRWWISVRGRAAHSSTPGSGVNAVHRAAVLVDWIEGPYAEQLAGRRHPLLGSPTVNVSKIEGGTQVNVVPDLARILLDRRLLPDESADSVRGEFEAIFRALKARWADFEALQEAPLLVDPSMETPLDHPWARRAAQLAADLGRSPEPLGVPYGTDGSKLAEAGIPTLVVGPGSIRQAHTADEYIDLSELASGARFYRELMLADLPPA